MKPLSDVLARCIDAHCPAGTKLMTYEELTRPSDAELKRRGLVWLEDGGKMGGPCTAPDPQASAVAAGLKGIDADAAAIKRIRDAHRAGAALLVIAEKEGLTVDAVKKIVR